MVLLVGKLEKHLVRANLRQTAHFYPYFFLFWIIVSITLPGLLQYIVLRQDCRSFRMFLPNNILIYFRGMYTYTENGLYHNNERSFKKFLDPHGDLNYH